MKTFTEEEVRKAIRDVNEFTGPMPPEISEPLRKACLGGDNDALENTMRTIVKLAKHEVLSNLGLS